MNSNHERFFLSNAEELKNYVDAHEINESKKGSNNMFL